MKLKYANDDEMLGQINADPELFRANIVIDTDEAYEEDDM